MDELELLKKDWQKPEGSQYPKKSYNDIYKMILKKSSSLVRWIFIISVGEFVLYLILPLLFPKLYDMKQYEGIHLYEASIITTILAYGILLYFSLNFYLNYRRISATDSTKKLMENIMRTRRAVKRYIWWVLSLNAVYMMVVSVATLIYDERMISIFEKASSQDKTTLLWAMFIGIMLFVTIMLTVVFWLFYQLLYGLLLRRLTKNYKELKKMELQ
jgi:hypothetical protein